MESLTGFARVREEFDLSLTEFAKVLGLPPSAKATVKALCDGTASNRYVRKHHAQFEMGLRTFFTQHLLSDEAVHQAIQTVFNQEVTMPQLKVIRLSPRARKHFGFVREPFPPQFSKDGDESYFECEELTLIEEKAMRAIKEHNLLAVLGDLGTGKTTLKKRLADQVEETEGELNLVWVHLPQMEELNAFNLIDVLLGEFGETPRLRKFDRIKQFTNLLADLDSKGKSVALAIDEAHRIPARTLRALKDFLEMIQVKKASRKRYGSYLGALLFGQSTFHNKLREFPEVAQRMEVLTMPSVGDHAHAYLQYRCQHAGVASEVFTQAAAARLARYGKTPLALNNLANEALQQAYLAGFKTIDDADGLLDWLDGAPLRIARKK